MMAYSPKRKMLECVYCGSTKELDLTPAAVKENSYDQWAEQSDENLNEQTISELSAIVKSHPGKTQLSFYILGRDHVALNLYSHDVRIRVTEELVDFIRESGSMDFAINQS